MVQVARVAAGCRTSEARVRVRQQSTRIDAPTGSLVAVLPCHHHVVHPHPQPPRRPDPPAPWPASIPLAAPRPRPASPAGARPPAQRRHEVTFTTSYYDPRQRISVKNGTRGQVTMIGEGHRVLGVRT